MFNLFFLLSAFITVLFIRKWYSNFNTLKGVPGPPSPSLLLGHTKQFKAKIGATHPYSLWQKRYGNTYRLAGFLSVPRLVLADPKGINHVLNGQKFIRNESDVVALEIFFGRGLLCAEGEEHRRMRKYLNGAFTNQSIIEVSHVFFELVDRLVDRWSQRISDGQFAFDIAPEIHMLTLDAISMTMFMHDLSATEGKIPDLLHKFTNSPGGDFDIILESLAAMFPFLLRLPSPIKKWATMLRTELGVIAREVWGGKENVSMHAKLLDSLASQDITESEAVAHIITILFAGSETTANVIAECFYELAQHPDIQQRVRDELSAFEASNGRHPNCEDLISSTALPYFDAVTREMMRLKAVLREICREAADDDVIPLSKPLPGTNDYQVTVKKGLVIDMPIRDGINVNEDIWGVDARVFNPERWLKPGALSKEVEMIRAAGHVLTFGDGPKVCLGRSFAIAEFKVIVSVLIRKFSFEPDGSVLDFYHLGGNTVKPLVRGKEAEGVQLPLKVTLL